MHWRPRSQASRVSLLHWRRSLASRSCRLLANAARICHGLTILLAAPEQVSRRQRAGLPTALALTTELLRWTSETGPPGMLNCSEVNFLGQAGSDHVCSSFAERTPHELSSQLTGRR